ncbi:hypothetical protein SAMN05428988_3175 [Chitinophaga sp. YR573]|nr:hypothetical protein SAMN05428988_3175 [Chitinophaga sp. YR573]
MRLKINNITLTFKQLKDGFVKVSIRGESLLYHMNQRLVDDRIHVDIKLVEENITEQTKALIDFPTLDTMLKNYFGNVRGRRKGFSYKDHYKKK